MTTTNDVRRGIYQRVTDPTGTKYLLHAVPSGCLGFSVYTAQGPIEAVVQTIGATIVNRLVFRGGWTVFAWRSDAYAPKRERLHKERFATKAEALAAFDRLVALAAVEACAAPPSTPDRPDERIVIKRDEERRLAA
jgi:hypothetical protein